ncbi:dual specificity protein phosphatase 12-like [Diadema antillarum]|uniref:dual specificity protein phosphatase 12-like n=1 Tax=Diadema antillarum TaxID=105358 RepID=UPI003A8C6AE9
MAYLHDADEIIPRLWLGSGEAAESPFFLADHKITHVLSVIFYTVKIPLESVQQKVISIMDQPGEDLLGHLNEAFSFINDGLESGGAVLVHCAMGVSRSSATVIAYIMNKEQCTLDEALLRVKEKHSQTCPNEGFMEQLRLFEAMGCQCNPGNSLFKQHRLAHLAEEIQSKADLPEDLLASDPHTADDGSNDALYRCRKCRRALFRQSSVIAHSQGKGLSSFGWHKQVKQQGQSPQVNVTGQGGQRDLASSSCTSVFIEPVSWMESFLLGVNEGKISCPKCSSRLGSFNWSGQQCSCGVWMTPAFQVHLNRVDRMTPIVR